MLVDVAEREAGHEWLHGETIAVRIVDMGGLLSGFQCPGATPVASAPSAKFGVPATALVGDGVLSNSS